MPDNQQQIQQPPIRQKLWEGLNKAGLYPKSFDDFEKQFTTPTAIEGLYKGMQAKGLYPKSINDFRAQFFADNIKPSLKETQKEQPLLKAPVVNEPAQKVPSIDVQSLPTSAHDAIAQGFGAIMDAKNSSVEQKDKAATDVLTKNWNEHKDNAVKDILINKDELGKLTKRTGGTQMDYVQFWKAPNNEIAVALENNKPKDALGSTIDNVAPAVSPQLKNLIKQAQKASVTKDDVNRFAVDENTHRTVFERIDKNLRKQGKTQDANDLAAAVYQKDRIENNSPEVDKNVEEIKKGNLKYNINTQELVRPLSGWAAVKSAFENRSKEYDEGNFLMAASPEERIKYLEKAIHEEYNPDKPKDMPEGIGALVGSEGMGMAKAFGAQIATTLSTKNPLLGITAGAEMQGLEYAPRSYRNESVRTYAQVKNELLKQGVPEEQAQKQAEAKATINGTIAMMTDFASNAAMAHGGMSATAKPLKYTFNKGVMDAARHIVKSPFKIAASGAKGAASMAVLGASGEFVKEAGSNLAGVKRETDIGAAAEAAATLAALHYVFHAGTEVVSGSVQASKATKNAVMRGLSKAPINALREVAIGQASSHVVKPEIAEATMREIEKHKAFMSQFPNVKDDHSLARLEDLVHEYNGLKEKLAKPEEGGVHESLHGPLKERQKEVEWEIGMLSQKPEDQVKTLKFKKAELERELSDHDAAIAEGKAGKLEDAAGMRKQVKEIDKKLSEVQERLDSPLHKAQKIADKHVMDDSAEWTNNEQLVELSRNDPEAFVQHVAEMANGDNPSVKELAIKNFGQPLVDAAVEAFPKPEKPRHTISHAGVAAIRPKERDLSIPEVNQSGSLPIGEDGKVEFGAFRQRMLEDALAVEDSSFNFRVDIPDMQMSERIGAMKDIEAGKESVRRTKLENAIQKMHETGTVPVTRGRGKHVESYDIPVEEWFGLNRDEQRAVAAEVPKVTDEDLSVIENEGITLQNLPKLKHLFDGFPYSPEQYAAIERHLSAQGEGHAAVKPVSEGSSVEPISTGEQNTAGEPVAGTVKRDVVEPPANTEFLPSESEPSVGVRNVRMKGEEPPAPPAEAPSTGTPESIGITHEQTEKVRAELGLPDYQKSPETIAQWDAEASQRLAKNPNEPVEVVDRMADPEYRPTPSDELLVIQYYADLKAKYNANPSDAVLAELKRVSDITDISGSRWGREGRARQLQVFVEETLADYNLRNMKETNTDLLTDAQKAANEKEFNKITDLQKADAEKMQKLEAENARLAAENELLKLKKTAAKGRKKTSQDYAKEREALREDLRKAKEAHEQWLKEQGIQKQGGGFTLTGDMVNIIGKIVKSYASEGIDKLETLVAKVFEEVKDQFGDGITEKDIHNIIAGEYVASDAKAKPTKNDLAETLYNLKQEAKLINEMERIQAGEKKNRSESKKQKDNKRLTELREQLAKMKKEKADSEPEKLKAYKKRTQEQIDEVQKKIANGDYSEAPKKKPLELDDEALDLKYELIQAKADRERRLLTEKYKNEPLISTDAEMGNGMILRIAAEVLNVPRSAMASVDLSAPLRQGLAAAVAHPKIAKEAFVQMHKVLKSDKSFQVWWDGQRKDPRFKFAQESKLELTDPHDPKMTAREEAFAGHLLEKLEKGTLGKAGKLVGKKGGIAPVAASNRAYTTYLNKLRLDIFYEGMDAFRANGKTPQNSPELYKALATHINNLTGRGKVIRPVQAFSPILNAAFFSPKLIASRINLMLNWANPMWWKNTPAPIRAMYGKDMAKFAAFGGVLAMLTKMAVNSIWKDDDVDFELDPRSSDFLKLRVGNTRFDFYGGFQQYIRAIAQSVSGQKKQIGTGKIVELDGKSYGGANRMTPIWSLLRGKSAPVPGAALDLIIGKDMVGNEMVYDWYWNPRDKRHPGGRTKTLDEKAMSIILPMSVQQYQKIFTDPGLKSIAETIFGMYGAGVQEYDEDEKAGSGGGGASGSFKAPKAPEAPEAPSAPQ